MRPNLVGTLHCCRKIKLIISAYIVRKMNTQRSRKNGETRQRGGGREMGVLISSIQEQYLFLGEKENWCMMNIRAQHRARKKEKRIALMLGSILFPNDGNSSVVG
jgi:hypothetical protein